MRRNSKAQLYIAFMIIGLDDLGTSIMCLVTIQHLAPKEVSEIGIITLFFISRGMIAYFRFL